MTQAAGIYPAPWLWLISDFEADVPFSTRYYLDAEIDPALL
jgi:hypothetical protein